MRSHKFPQLLSKEWNELWSSRAFWLLLLIIGPLVGHAFITAVNLYAEASGIGGGPAALSEGLTPLDGILVPTWGAYDLAATLLFPFVAIRLVSAEKESGALKLLLQLPGSLASKITAKGLVLVAGWVVAWLPAIVAMVLWRSYGGHLYRPETVNIMLGHLLRGFLSAGVAVASAAIAESAASAAIVTLAVTVGTWALDFIAAGRGGIVQQLANYTPTAALRSFEQGLLRVNTLLIMLLIAVAGFSLAAIWLHTGRSVWLRLFSTLMLALVLASVTVGVGTLRTSWDLSENHRNSFSQSDEAALRTVNSPLLITVVLSPEDPRLTDYEQNILKKLRRVLPNMKVDYAAGSQTGLFENAEDHYGEIWYEMNGQKVMDRSTIEQVVLEQIYKLAAVPQPQHADDNGFSGYPLATQPRWAAWIFYAAWPLLIACAWWLLRR